jgi:hypothetical protein
MKDLQKAIETPKPDDLDKIRAYLMQETDKLSDKLTKQLHKYLKVQALLEKRYTKSDILKIIQAQDFFEVGEKIELRQAYNIYQKSVDLLGDINQINKEVERYFSHQRYLKLSKKLEDKGDEEAAAKVQKIADEVIGLFEPDEKEKYEASLYFTQVVIQRTSDPEILKKSQLDRKPVIEIDEAD